MAGKISPDQQPGAGAGKGPEITSPDYGANGRAQASARQTPRQGMVTREMILARFIRLCSSIFSTPNKREAAALVVNRISELVRVDRAVLVRLQGNNPIIAVTGGGAVAQDSLFADAVEAVRKRYGDRQEAVVVPSVAAKNGGKASVHLAKIQKSMGGTNILWLPLWLSNDKNIIPEYAMWLERWHGHRWDPPDIELLQHAALFLGHGLKKAKVETKTKKRSKRLIIALAILIFLCLPINSSVTSPVNVIPDSPHHIFAPMDGILKELYVRPGQWVEKGDILFHYDSRVLDKRLDEAYRNVGVAKSKLVKLEGAAHRDPEAGAELPIQRLEVKRAEADVKFYASQRARANVKTAKSGMVVLDDPDALIGAALQTGQAVLSVADPSKTKLRIMVPASDVGFIKKGARVSVRLDSNPLKSYSAVVTRIGFEVKISDKQIPSIPVDAIWIDDIPDIQPGQRGSAKIYGPPTFMGIQILRKPLIAIRSVTGF